MKNLFTTTIIIICASILLTSCNASLTKRHYRKGYFVQNSNKIKTKPVERTNQEQVVSTTIPPLEVAVQERVLPQPANNSFNSETQLNSLNSGEIAPVNNPINSLSNSESINSTPPAYNSDNKGNTSQISTENTVKVAASSNEDARSFFWTLILVILIIWIVAVL